MGMSNFGSPPMYRGLNASITNAYKQTVRLYMIDHYRSGMNMLIIRMLGKE